MSENQERETKQQDAAVRKESHVDDAQGQSQKKQTVIAPSSRSDCRYRVKDRKYVVLTPKGAVAARTIHRMSEDQKWESEIMSRVKGAPLGLQGRSWRRCQRWLFLGESRCSPARFAKGAPASCQREIIIRMVDLASWPHTVMHAVSAWRDT